MFVDPPEPPACQPDDAELFDNDFTYGMALAICERCTVRDWCLEQVDPARNFYDGVVGGHAWREGKPLDKLTKPSRDGTLIYYLGRRGLLKKLN